MALTLFFNNRVNFGIFNWHLKIGELVVIYEKITIC